MFCSGLRGRGKSVGSPDAYAILFSGAVFRFWVVRAGQKTGAEIF
jgi:hypothetical protein